MKNNFVQGVNGKYSFYVIAFDTKNNCANYGSEYIDLTLNQAQDIYSKAILENPKHINTMLGTAYVTDNQKLDRWQITYF